MDLEAEVGEVASDAVMPPASPADDSWADRAPVVGGSGGIAQRRSYPVGTRLRARVRGKVVEGIVDCIDDGVIWLLVSAKKGNQRVEPLSGDGDEVLAELSSRARG